MMAIVPWTADQQASAEADHERACACDVPSRCDWMREHQKDILLGLYSPAAMSRVPFDEKAAIVRLAAVIHVQVDRLVADAQTNSSCRPIRYRLLEIMAASYGKWDDDNEQGPGRETGGGPT